MSHLALILIELQARKLAKVIPVCSRFASQYFAMGLEAQDPATIVLASLTFALSSYAPKYWGTRQVYQRFIWKGPELLTLLKILLFGQLAFEGLLLIAFPAISLKDYPPDSAMSMVCWVMVSCSFLLAVVCVAERLCLHQKVMARVVWLTHLPLGNLAKARMSVKLPLNIGDVELALHEKPGILSCISSFPVVSTWPSLKLPGQESKIGNDAIDHITPLFEKNVVYAFKNVNREWTIYFLEHIRKVYLQMPRCRPYKMCRDDDLISGYDFEGIAKRWEGIFPMKGRNNMAYFLGLQYDAGLRRCISGETGCDLATWVASQLLDVENSTTMDELMDEFLQWADSGLFSLDNGQYYGVLGLLLALQVLSTYM